MALEGETVSVETILAKYASLKRGAAGSIAHLRSDPDRLVDILANLCNEWLIKDEEALGAVAELLVLIPFHSQRVHDLEDLGRKVSEQRATHAKSLAEEASVTDQISKQVTSVEHTQKETDALRASMERLSRLEALVLENSKLENLESTLRERILQHEKDVQSALRVNEELERRISEASTAIKLNAPRNVVLLTQLHELETIQHDFADYSRNRDLLTSSQARFAEKSKKTTALLADLHELGVAEVEISNKLQELNDSLSKTTERTSSITQSALAMRQHSKDGVCPLCGHNHGSESILQSAIDSKLGALSSQVLALQEQLADFEQKRQNHLNKIAGVQKLIAQNKKDVAEINAEIAVYSATCNAFVERLTSVGATNNPDDLVKMISVLHEENKRVEEALERARNDLRLVGENLSQEQSKSLPLIELLKDERSRIDKLALDKMQVQNQMSVIQDLLGKPLPTLAAVGSLLNENQREHQKHLDRLSALQAELNSVRKKTLQLEESIQASERSLAEVSRLIEDFLNRWRSLDLPEPAVPSDIENLRIKTNADKDTLLSFQKTLSLFKVQRKRNILEEDRNSLRQQYNSYLMQSEAIREESTKLKAACMRAGSWETDLASLVGKYVVQRLNQHRADGFRMFRSMVPTPDQFDDIAISRGEEGVRLGLHLAGFEGDLGEPRFYLSSAQANVLALSYFLSFAVSQRWCKLQTLLMDDPVQHLDDLDATAFLDILRSIAVSPRTKRQIIVTTCDMNLYALMIRKFDQIDPARVRFTAISLHDRGADGPSIQYDHKLIDRSSVA